MHIDWGQIVTHAIGFLLAVWLLKRYAWGHLLGFVEKRRETIAASFDEIEKGKAEVLQRKTELAKEFEGIEATRRQRIQEAAREAEQLAAQIKEDARQEAIAAREKVKQDVAIEMEKANELFKDYLIDTILTASGKIIDERLDRETHNRLIDDFLNNVKVK
jgi:F-type H+-transporting ATPase subunit b